MELSRELQKLLDEMLEITHFNQSYEDSVIISWHKIQNQYQKDKDPYAEVFLLRCKNCNQMTTHPPAYCKCGCGNFDNEGTYVRKSK